MNNILDKNGVSNLYKEIKKYRKGKGRKIGELIRTSDEKIINRLQKNTTCMMEAIRKKIPIEMLEILMGKTNPEIMNYIDNNGYSSLLLMILHIKHYIQKQGMEEEEMNKIFKKMLEVTNDKIINTSRCIISTLQKSEINEENKIYIVRKTGKKIINGEDYHGRSILFLAIEYNNTEKIIKEIMDKTNKETYNKKTYRDYDELTCLDIAIKEESSIEIIFEILKKTDTEKYTEYEREYTKKEIQKLLIKLGENREIYKKILEKKL